MNRISIAFLFMALLTASGCSKDIETVPRKKKLPDEPPAGWSVVINADMNAPRFCSYALFISSTNAVIYRGRKPHPTEQNISIFSTISETAEVALPESVSSRIYSLACKLFEEFIPSNAEGRGGGTSYMLDMHLWPRDVVSIRRGPIEPNTREHERLDEILSLIESQSPRYEIETEESERSVTQHSGETDEIYVEKLVQEILAVESVRGALSLTVVYTNNMKTFGRGEIVYPE